MFDRVTLLRLDVRKFYHLAPLLGFVDDELGKVGSRKRQRREPEIRKARLHLGIGEARVDFPVELLDDLGGGAFWRPHPPPFAPPVAPHQTAPWLGVRPAPPACP